MAGRMSFPKHSLTLIVKGTFDLANGSKAKPASDPLFPTGDEYYPDDEDGQGAPRYASDFAPFKPRADVLIVGKCHAPGGGATTESQVSVRVGEKHKTLRVFGERYWRPKLLNWTASEPHHFKTVELRYENSFGGPKFKKNPVGRGADSIKDGADGELWPLPPIENPACLIRGRRDRPEPAGYGPLAAMWETRAEKLGTYKGDYLKTRWPWFPNDFDWGYFNVAPEDMQVQGYLRGDEKLCFENLHSKHPKYESQLPALRLRCFVNRRAGTQSREMRFDEVKMNLDTLWVDMEAEKLVLIWRGWTEVASETFEEIQDIFIMSEPLDQSLAPVEQCRRQFLARQAEEGAPVAPEEPPPADRLPVQESVENPDSDPKILAERAKQKEEMQKYLEAQTAAIHAQFGLSPDDLPPDVRAAQKKLIDRLAETDREKLRAMETKEANVQLNSELANLGIDPKNLPPMSEKALGEQARLMKELGLNGVKPENDPESVGMWAVMAALLPKMGIDPENLGPVIELAKEQKAKSGEISDAPAASAQATPPAATSHDLLRQRVAAGEKNFHGEDLRGLDFSEMDLKGADFSSADLSGVPMRKTVLTGANLSQAKLKGADLSGADLTTASLAGADLDGANMQGCCLKEADASGAKFQGANLSGAVLDGATLEGALLTGANLAEASAVKTAFVAVDLSDACLRKGNFPGANFSEAVLARADFQDAKLQAATVTKARGQRANLARATLTGLRAGGDCDFSAANFRNSKANDSIWEKANLTGADFRYAQLEDAMFVGACLKEADLSAANMRSCRFANANLREAKLIQVNLFEGSLEKADLTRTNLSGSNLYGVEFLGAVIDQTITTGANLKMTKLAIK